MSAARAAQTFYHEIAGVRYPRVSHILSILREPGLEKWRARLGDDAADAKANAASRLGTALHKRIELFLNGKRLPPTKSKPLVRVWECWQDWFAAQAQPAQAAMQGWQSDQERLRWRSDPHGGYAGTPDLVLHAPERTVVDWKCTSRIKELYFAQMHLYVPLIWPHDTNAKPIALKVIRIDPDLGIWQPDERHYNPDVAEDCMALLRVYRRWYFDPAIKQLDLDTQLTSAALED